MRLLKLIWYLPRLILSGLVWVYQKTLSPDHSWMRHYFQGGYCKYTPTCSEYARLVIKKRGAIVGSWLAIVRIFKCNPCSKGGYDPP